MVYSPNEMAAFTGLGTFRPGGLVPKTPRGVKPASVAGDPMLGGSASLWPIIKI